MVGKLAMSVTIAIIASGVRPMSRYWIGRSISNLHLHQEGRRDKEQLMGPEVAQEAWETRWFLCLAS